MKRTYAYNIAYRQFGLRKAFTIVELLIVVVVIAVLSSIAIVTYNGITNQAKESALKSELSSGARKLHLVQVETGVFPSFGPANTDNSTFIYSNTDSTFCLQATGNNKTFYITERSSIAEGECPSPVLQIVTTSTCPETRTLAVDARDNHTYWIQKLPDGKCWMLTNLAYAGGVANGGTNIYNDVIPTGDGSSGTLNGPDNSGSYTHTLAKYYASATHGTLYTTTPISPSTDTTGGGTGMARQYGYNYNWCAAMGAQTSTSACANTTTPAPDTTKSICPANWRLPTGGSTGEFALLNNAVNDGLTNADTGLRTEWLGQLGGSWLNGFSGQGSQGRYWSATQYAATSVNLLSFNSSNVSPSSGAGKYGSFSVRCVAAL